MPTSYQSPIPYHYPSFYPTSYPTRYPFTVPSCIHRPILLPYCLLTNSLPIHRPTLLPNSLVLPILLPTSLPHWLHSMVVSTQLARHHSTLLHRCVRNLLKCIDACTTYLANRFFGRVVPIVASIVVCTSSIAPEIDEWNRISTIDACS